MSQTAIPTPAEEPITGPCAWCGDPPIGTVEVERARWGKAANGVRVLKKRAIVVPACREHFGITARQS